MTQALTPSPIKQRLDQRAQQPHQQIYDGIFHPANHLCAEESIQYVFIEFPEDRRCPGAGDREEDLDGKWDLTHNLLRMADRHAEKIRDRNPAQEVSGNIQGREQLEKQKTACKQIESQDT